MRYKKIIITLLILSAVGFGILKLSRQESPNKDEVVSEIKPFFGLIANTFSATGSVLPRNRLEMKPPVNGRVDEILVKEGDRVEVGTILGWMSSTERAALLDAARGQGEETLSYWKDVYKPIALISPIAGEVIVSKTQPGQTVTTNDAVVVLSDQLIVRAQVDETDIGKVKVDQNVFISLGAYPDTKISAKVNQIYYESTTVNNVTMYEVDLMPDEIPEILRSGMNTTIDFVVENKKDILLLPNDTILKDKEESYVLLKSDDSGNPTKRFIKIGVADDNNTEIISGITLDDVIISKAKKYSLPKTNTLSNPFMPSRNPSRKGAK